MMKLPTPTTANAKIAVVIPCYKVKRHIIDVISRIGPTVDRIYVVDDACPENSGQWVKEHCADPRVSVIHNQENLGVGGAVKNGYRIAIQEKMDIAVKIDGDGQMSPELIPFFVRPIVEGKADYTKGNRFFNLENIRRMPGIRIFGNAVLSFFSKFSSGYWSTFDPTNGYTAAHLNIVNLLPLNKISNRYFFESDMLFRLNLIQAKVMDIPMDAHYGDEVSGLKINKILFEFLQKHTKNSVKRIFYNYFLRDFSAASLELASGLILICFGISFGAAQWIRSSIESTSSSAGTVMLAALPILIGIQLLLSFVNFDVQRQPKEAVWPNLNTAHCNDE